MKYLIAFMIVLASAWVADGQGVTVGNGYGLQDYEPAPCPDGIPGCLVLHWKKKDKFTFTSRGLYHEYLAVQEHTGNVTLHIDGSRDWGTREITFKTDDRSFTFTAEELKNMLNRKTYTAKVKVKK